MSDQACIDELDRITTLRPFDEWHEDHGDVLWWLWPIDQPPYCGTPLDDDWPWDDSGHVTYGDRSFELLWSPLPADRFIRRASTSGEATR